MKKILLATTAVALTAGAAYAEGTLTVSGNARFGLQYNEAPGARLIGGVIVQNGETTIEKRMTVDFDGSVESASGLTFGARVRIRSEENIAGVVSGARVFLQTGGFTFAMGNIDGALESTPGLYDPSVGLTGLGWGGLVTNTAARGSFGWDSFSSTANGAEGAEIMYSGGGFSGHLSYSDNSAGGLSSNLFNSAQERIAVNAAYTTSGWTFALGYQDSDIDLNDKWLATVSGKFGDTYGVTLGYGDNDGIGKWALSGYGTWGATTVTAYVADEDSAVATDTNYGLGVQYDLGGATIDAGIAGTAVGTTRADFGVRFNF